MNNLYVIGNRMDKEKKQSLFFKYNGADSLKNMSLVCRKIMVKIRGFDQTETWVNRNNESKDDYHVTGDGAIGVFWDEKDRIYNMFIYQTYLDEKTYYL